MKNAVQIAEIGLVTYEESFWTGKKKILVDGQEASKVNKKTFRLNDLTMELKGNYVQGVKLMCNGQVHTVVRATYWYEYLLALLPFLFVMIWGNSPALCQIFPIVGGAIGGAVSCVMLILQITVFRLINHPLIKILFSLAVLVATLLLLFLLALVL